MKGVTRARVDLEKHEALVTYDPAVATVDDLVKAVGEAKGMHPYGATVKEKEKPKAKEKKKTETS